MESDFISADKECEEEEGMGQRERKRQRQSETDSERLGTLRNKPGHAAFVPSDNFYFMCVPCSIRFLPCFSFQVKETEPLAPSMYGYLYPHSGWGLFYLQEDRHAKGGIG